MPQIALVADKHDDDVGVGVVSQLLQPSRDILVGLVLADVVDKKGTDGTTVVGRGDGTIALLAGGIPDLCLDGLGINLDRAGGELDADGRLGVQVELVASESTQQIGFSDSRVSNQHHCSEGMVSVRGERSRLSRRAGAPLKRNYGASID